MKRAEFLTALIDAVQIEEEISEATVLADIEEWDSLAAVTALALFNKKLSLKTGAANVKACVTVADLLNLGNEKYE